MIIYGVNTVLSALRHKAHDVLELMLTADKPEFIELAEQYGISINRVKKNTLDKLTEGNHQGVAARIKKIKIFTEKELLLSNFEKNTLLLIVDGVQDPHNFGAILRTANAFGVTAVIIPKNNTVKVTPIVSKVASGAAETTPIYIVNNLARTLKELKKQGVWLIGTALEGAMPINKLECEGKIAVIVGSEGKGIRTLTAKLCDHLVYIPMQGTVESLNVAVATGVVLAKL